jgi:hypothetical protein
MTKKRKNQSPGVGIFKEVLKATPASMSAWVSVARALGWKLRGVGSDDPYEAPEELTSPEGLSFVFRPATTYLAEPVDSFETSRLDRWMREETGVLQQVKERLGA